MDAYFNDFKSFYHGHYLNQLEQTQEKNAVAEANRAQWFKGIMDAFNQAPNDEKYWNLDSYFMGYQRGTEILRSLMKESKQLFKTEEEPTNKFVEEQRQLAEIIKRLEYN
jgi:hypothetical protein